MAAVHRDNRATICRRWVSTVCLCLVVSASGPAAQPPDRRELPGGPDLRTLSSKSFLLHTDLSADEGRELLMRLETMLGFVAGYWGRPHRGVIEMYVARQIESWPGEVLANMAPEGVASIRGGGGVTLASVAVLGNEFRSKAVVYAVADHGTPQHEAVHAYCDHAFGGTGPVWYAEGMAEVGNYWVEGDKGVSAPTYVLDYLHRSPARDLDAIVNNPLEQTGDSWKNYAWRWALCHLLGHNENYAPRFKPLGLALLNRKDVDFWQVYGSHAEEIDFEYCLFLQNVTPGYRVDLCSWDWKTRFTSPAGGRAVVAKVDAARGWQASRLAVSEGTEYEYLTSGAWSLDEQQGQVSPAGVADGHGRLMGVILTDYTLSEPFSLGASGTFTAGAGGKLFLRCHDEWGAIADNVGSVTLRAKVKGAGRPLIHTNATDGPASSSNAKDGGRQGEQALKVPVDR